MISDQEALEMALSQAMLAAEAGEVPIGATAVYNAHASARS